jgi:hypothetical protein
MRDSDDPRCTDTSVPLSISSSSSSSIGTSPRSGTNVYLTPQRRRRKRGQERVVIHMSGEVPRIAAARTDFRHAPRADSFCTALAMLVNHASGKSRLCSFSSSIASTASSPHCCGALSLSRHSVSALPTRPRNHSHSTPRQHVTGHGKNCKHVPLPPPHVQISKIIVQVRHGGVQAIRTEHAVTSLAFGKSYHSPPF